ncbi:unnamed protein product [Hermetia illucens]|uniref:DUF4806 domain-containing protein n=1 Tax=Hermetia illucens TaxID=343691 RepID=A0A7R8YQS6_HERIL|nr:unnamed protein product [Hermetia illucens]
MQTLQRSNRVELCALRCISSRHEFADGHNLLNAFGFDCFLEFVRPMLTKKMMHTTLSAQRSLLDNKTYLVSEKIVKQNQAIMDVLASHSVLLNKIYKNETMPTEVSTVFPIKTVEELEKLNNGISEEDIPFYVATVKMKIKAGGLIKNFSKLISEDICLKYNYNGTHGKLPFCQYLKINGIFEGAVGDENYTSLIKQPFKRAKNNFFKKECLKRK